MSWIACVIEFYLLKRIDAISLGKYFSILKYENISEYALYKLNTYFSTILCFHGLSGTRTNFRSTHNF